jgi:hypothetical protein
MTTKLADTRSMTMESARACLEQIAHAKCRLAREEARYELQIARAKSAFQAATAEDLSAVARLEAHLTAYVLAHPQEFEKPRAVVTDFGKFGLRTVANVEITDRQAVIDWALRNGHQDALKVTQTPVLPALARRLRDGESIPGAELREGEEAFYAVAKALVEEAAKAAA